MHVLPGLINCEVEFGLGEWMKLWMNWGVSHWLYFWCLPGVDYCCQGIQIVSCASWFSYWIIWMWFWWRLSTAIRECLNQTKMLLAIVYILLKNNPRPALLSMGLILLAPLATSSQPVCQGLPHLVYFIGLTACFSGMFNTAVPSMSPTVALKLVEILFLVNFWFISSWFLGVRLVLEFLLD